MQNLGNLIIRNAFSQDAEGIAAVHIKGWQESYKGIIDQDYLNSLTKDFKARSHRWQKLILDLDANSSIFVAILADEIIGFCSAGPMREYSTSKGELYAIYLLDEFKGLGIGKMLWDKALEHLKHKNLIPFDIVMLEANLTARRFYERQHCKFATHLVGKIGNKEYTEVKYTFS